MRGCCIALVAMLSCGPAQSQPSTNACQQSSFREFDFWIGHWDVNDQEGKPAGQNLITLEQGGCVLIERWTSAAGGTGMSMNHYDPRSRQWHQHWVSPNVILDMSGGMQGDSLVLEGPLQYVGKETTVLRGTWTPLPDGRVRQLFLESKDGGKTWAQWFDGYYTKKK